MLRRTSTSINEVSVINRIKDTTGFEKMFQPRSSTLEKNYTG
jgi:hypothetical protein